MTIETALYPTQLNAELPPQSDIVREGAGHFRLLKTVVKTTFPNLGGAWNATQTEANYIVGVTSPIQAQINSKGAITGQTWTGAHVFSGTAAVPTLAQGTNTTGAASTAFVQAEWATRLPNYTAPITASSTELNHLVGVTSGVQSQINAKGAIAGQTWTGTHSFPSTTTVGPLTPAIQGYLSTATSDVQAQINSKAAKAGDTYTGAHNYTGATISVPTLSPGSSGNGAASVDYANALAFASALPAQTGNSGKFITTNGVTASWSDTIDGNINFTGTARRITGDFSNGTIANRVLFQTSTVNGQTSIGVLPNGASDISNINVFGSSDPANASLGQFVTVASDTVAIKSSATGSGAFLPLTFHAGNAERLRINPTTGNVLATGGTLGYGIGNGGTATQPTSITSNVILNKPNGVITLANGSITGSGIIVFQLENTFITENSIVVVHGIFTGTGTGITQFTPQVTYVQTGVAFIQIKNNNAGAVLTDGVTLRFAVFAGSAS